MIWCARDVRSGKMSFILKHQQTFVSQLLGFQEKGPTWCHKMKPTTIKREQWQQKDLDLEVVDTNPNVAKEIFFTMKYPSNSLSALQMFFHVRVIKCIELLCS